MMVDNTIRCSSCCYLGENIDDEKICRRHAPVPDPESGPHVTWPLVRPDHDWCGEHPVMQKERDEP